MAHVSSKGGVRIAVILNGISLKKKFFHKKVLPALTRVSSVDVFETRAKNDATSFASAAVDKQYDIILAAGGDGTLNQVLNGIITGRENLTELPALGVLPLGSGNDFARSLKISRRVNKLIKRIESFSVRKFDVGKINFTDDEGKSALSYFINVVDAGMGPEVVNRMSRNRFFGSAIAYYSGILTTFFTYKSMTVKIKTTAWEWENKLRTLALANGKFYGHGLCIAPDAKPDDGVFSTFVCGDVSILEFIRYSGTLKKSKKINHPKVTYSSAKHIELTSDKPCRIEADGELLGFLPATIDVLPGKIKFLC